MPMPPTGDAVGQAIAVRLGLIQRATCGEQKTGLPSPPGDHATRRKTEPGDYCATPVKTCLLYNSSWIGNGCSCKVYDGYARGTVE